MIKIKRVYQIPEEEDGHRILVDRLWPRGMSKEDAKLDLWLKEVAPSDDLRKWFGHDPERWSEFQKRYREELKNKKSLLSTIKNLEEENRTITLIYAAKDEEHNNAVVLRDKLHEV
ncbi:MAG TPA: DUF488 domain-containing protein [Methanobacterium sp.]